MARTLSTVALISCASRAINSNTKDIGMSDNKRVKNLSEFVERVHEFREEWKPECYKELWFRGESSEYRDRETFLRPELYRPRLDKKLRKIDELLEVESDLYESFQHSAVQLSTEKAEDENWD